MLVPTLAPWLVAGAALALPIHVVLHPERFGAERLASPLPTGQVGFAPGDGRFATLAPLVDRAVRGAGTSAPDGIDGGTQLRRPPLQTSPATPVERAPPTSLSYRVRAVAGSAVLVVDRRGAHVVRPGEALPSGERLAFVRPDGTPIVRSTVGSVDAPAAASPAQGWRAKLSANGGR